MPQSTTSRAEKPDKPYPDFPLFAHATRRWAKKIRGKLHYFGPWDEPYNALEKYLSQSDDLHAGRIPRVQGDGVTVRDVVNRFLTAKKHLLETGEIVDRTFRDYYTTCERVLGAFGRSRLVTDLRADDFEHLRRTLAKKRGPVALGNEVQRVRMIFKYAFDQEMIDRPVRYGQTFRKPSRKTLRIARAANGRRMFEADELRTVVNAASPPLKAMTLLGINCGFGQSDIAALPRSALDLQSGWIDYARTKTGVDRRCPLWPETEEALQEATTKRPNPKDAADADLVFLTKYGHRWVKTYKPKAVKPGDEELERGRTPGDAVGQQFGKLLINLDLKRARLNFYALRHTFETIGGESLDQVAVNHIMGHTAEDMPGTYRERVSDERLRAVVNFIHAWLFDVADVVDDGDDP